jgi:hypothetical protein
VALPTSTTSWEPEIAKLGYPALFVDLANYYVTDASIDCLGVNIYTDTMPTGTTSYSDEFPSGTTSWS